MKQPHLDLKSVVPICQMRGESRQEAAALRKLYREARGFLESFAWCRSTAKSYFGMGIGGVVAVFLFKIVPRGRDVDRWLWVVVGDLPPAYLVADRSPTPVKAVQSYISEMSKWVKAVRSGKSVAELIPVNVSPNRIWARRLQCRLDFLKREVIPRYRNRAAC